MKTLLVRVKQQTENAKILAKMYKYRFILKQTNNLLYLYY